MSDLHREAADVLVEDAGALVAGAAVGGLVEPLASGAPRPILALSARSGTIRRLVRDRSAVTGLVIVIFLVLLTILGPALAPKDPLQIDTGHLLKGPSHAAWFGTDNLGRDIFSRVLAAARTSIPLALVIGALMIVIGTIVGAVAGYFGSWVDSTLMRVVDVFLAFPSLVLSLAIAGTLGAGDRSVIIALVATGWPTYARLVRGGVLAERERDYVEAVRGAGARPRRIVLRHILPNAASPIMVLLSFDLGTIVLFIASLGYLGVGIPPPTPEWGTMVSDGKNFIFSAPQMVIFPGLAVALTVIGFNLLGDGLRNALDPRHELGARRRLLRSLPARLRGSRSSQTAPAVLGATDARGPASAAQPGRATTGGSAILEVDSLRVRITSRHTNVEPVSGVSLSVASGETVGLVGESGCGKTMTALAILRLLPPGGAITGGAVRVGGRDVTALSGRELRAIRGREVGMVFQDPLTSLNPTMPIGAQIADPVRFHLRLSKAAARERAAEVLALVGMPQPAERLADYPHQLSGGQRQRVMIAMALACEPKLLIADEPTTALDVSIQDQILALLDDLRMRLRMGMLLITHDMGVMSRMADRILVMYAGRIIESAPTTELFAHTRHPYTEALLESIPRLDQDRPRQLYSIPGRPPALIGLNQSCAFAPRCRYATARCEQELPLLGGDEPGHSFACFHPVSGAPAPTISGAPVPTVSGAPPLTVAAGPGAAAERPGRTEQLIVVDHVVKQFRARRGPGAVQAVSDVSFSVAKGETFGLVGESGCGKTTLGRIITALEQPDSGTVVIGGRDVHALNARELREARREFQLIFQDPFASLDPRIRIGPTLTEPMRIHHLGTRASRTERVNELLDEVGLERQSVERYPHQFSGGQRQRIGFGRVLTLQPDLIVADEPVSALDVSIRSQVLNLMRRLQDDHDLTYILISHDLSVVRYLADRVGVMYLGKLVEIGPSHDLYSSPAHPYTAGLLAAIPIPDPQRERHRVRAAMQGEPPTASNPPSGCRFRTRCPLAQPVCAVVEPPLQAPEAGGHLVACHFPLVPTPASTGNHGVAVDP
ncbi:MAG: dipeptide ABC transporter ATP-binding protein [Acidimicrobiales bacterium]